MAAAKKKGTATTTRLRKVECPHCGCIVRMSRAAMQRSGLPTCGCGTGMIPPDLEDAALVMTDAELRDHPEYREARAQEVTSWTRALIRTPRSSGGKRFQCHGCRRFITHPGAWCSGCGYQNDPRPGAGGYRAGAAGMAWNIADRDTIPF